MKLRKKIIIEKILGIPPDYQYKALRSKNFLQANWHRNKLAVLGNIINLNKKMRILDLGTGSGNFELRFAKNVREIVGLDYNDEAINFIKRQLKERNIKNVKLINEDVRNLYKMKGLGKFDVILMVDVIEHLRLAASVKVVSCFRTLLAKGGQVVIITPNYKSSWELLEWALDKFNLAPSLNDAQHLARFEPDNLSELFRKQGFTTETLGSFNFISFIVPKKNISQKLAVVELRWPFFTGNLLAGKFVL